MYGVVGVVWLAVTFFAVWAFVAAESFSVALGGNGFWAIGSLIFGVALFFAARASWAGNRVAAWTLIAFGVEKLTLTAHRGFWVLAEITGPGTECGPLWANWSCGSIRDVMVGVVAIGVFATVMALRHYFTPWQMLTWGVVAPVASFAIVGGL